MSQIKDSIVELVLTRLQLLLDSNRTDSWYDHYLAWWRCTAYSNHYYDNQPGSSNDNNRKPYYSLTACSCVLRATSLKTPQDELAVRGLRHMLISPFKSGYRSCSRHNHPPASQSRWNSNGDHNYDIGIRHSNGKQASETDLAANRLTRSRT